MLFRRIESGLYALDTWKLILNDGLRWGLEQAQRDKDNWEAQFSPTVGNPSAAGLLGRTEYEGHGQVRCNCIYEKFYPQMTQPRLAASALRIA